MGGGPRARGVTHVALALILVVAGAAACTGGGASASDGVREATVLDPAVVTVDEATDELLLAALGSAGSVRTIARVLVRQGPDPEEELWEQLGAALDLVDTSLLPYLELLRELSVDDPDGELARGIEDGLGTTLADAVADLDQLTDGVELARRCHETRDLDVCAEVQGALKVED